ncbi:DUF4105 domain-containing protein [Bizionia gelidisalsuginis]|uniref:DUF4105 domain-containing protein n=2 Tax=Bizionia TaxID=283785 RepID=A0A8H2QKJ3_9FLAO|nr:MULTISPECIES: DUF4105 domain-containing protein [Bizionia]TYB80150.1 DUF4105 domain-containing protein [Bizionia saleffrena]TYC16996.1 DUF4105 domain-containing protein [Bizionia gelidisalsuginis]
MKKLILISALIISVFSTAQNNPLIESAQFSVLTIGPGTSLNDAFGHSGFRVKTSFSDDVYNYGMFNFNAPNFYLNFAKGQLDYYMGANTFKNFKEVYVWQNRTIKEQVLNLTPAQKNELYTFLIHNLKPENKYYAYDFFFDNCATRIRDVSEKAWHSDLQYTTPQTYKAETFRTLIQNNLKWNSWGSFGIDVALGSVIDTKATPREYMFLPEYVYQFFEETTFKSTGEPLVKESHTIYKKRDQESRSSFFTSPLLVFSILSLIILFITYTDYKKKTRSTVLDLILFTITGLIGVLLCFLWFATDHSATAANYNVLWAFPLSLFCTLQLLKKTPKKWFIGYLKLLVVMLCLLTLHWSIGVQRFAPVLIPLLVALAIRYIYLIWFYAAVKE